MREKVVLTQRWTTGHVKNATVRCPPLAAHLIPTKGRSTHSSKLYTKISFWKIFKLPKTNSKLSKMRMMLILHQTRRICHNTFVRVVKTSTPIKMRRNSSRLSSSIVSTSRRTLLNCASTCYSSYAKSLRSNSNIINLFWVRDMSTISQAN